MVIAVSSSTSVNRDSNRRNLRASGHARSRQAPVEPDDGSVMVTRW